MSKPPKTTTNPIYNSLLSDPNDDDAYITHLLTTEARLKSQQYSAIGLPALLGASGSNRSRNAPKPNTRFLRTLVREADNHNAALLKKEVGERRERERERERRGGERSKSRSKSREKGRKRSRERRRGDRDRGRGRDWDGDRGMGEGDARRKRRRRSPSRPRSRSPSRSRSRLREGSVDAERKRERRSERHWVRNRSREKGGDSHGRAKDRDRDRVRHHASSRRREHRLTSRRRHDKDKDKDKDKGKDNEGSRSSRHKHRHRGKSQSKERDHHHYKPHRRKPNNPSSPPKSPQSKSSNPHPRSPSPDDTSDNDNTSLSEPPLSPLIGPVPPLPAPSIRGRGSTRTFMATHFSDSEPPTTLLPRATTTLPTPPNPFSPSSSSWDEALAAFRTRQKWKAAGAERLRSAGFGEDFVKRWEENTSGERDEKDIRWTEKGGVREWDRGKVVGEEGEVTLRAPW